MAVSDAVLEAVADLQAIRSRWLRDRSRIRYEPDNLKEHDRLEMEFWNRRAEVFARLKPGQRRTALRRLAKAPYQLPIYC